MEFEEQSSRRLPVYLLLDCSGSMAGAPIEAVNQGLSVLVNELRSDPMAFQTAWVSVITFDSEARQVTPLTEIGSFTPPVLTASGTTALGGALRVLNDALDRDIIANSPDRKGDYKPLMFLFTDGEPTDDWEGAAQAIKSRTQKKLANIIALGCGSGVNTGTLKRITEQVLLMQDATPDAIKQYFKWVSQSVKQVSTSANQGGTGGAALPATPPGVIMVNW